VRPREPPDEVVSRPVVGRCESCRLSRRTLAIRRGAVVEHHAILARDRLFGMALECEIEGQRRALEILRQPVWLRPRVRVSDTNCAFATQKPGRPPRIFPARGARTGPSMRSGVDHQHVGRDTARA
jgi:hypothetical protein